MTKLDYLRAYADAQEINQDDDSDERIKQLRQIKQETKEEIKMQQGDYIGNF